VEVVAALELLVAEADDDADEVAGTMADADEEVAAPSVVAGAAGFFGRFNFLDFHSSLR
jgi:hypothetical protein